ncbi:MAG TPA: hypothetical protein VJ249_01185 [Candidatus Bathyarchaeia archaeon]|nr:hypothetical protein [Candidatus Bathyarchaeia archaeon]
MRANRRYLVAVALLVALAIVFGLVGTVAPPLAEPVAPQQESSSSSSSSSNSTGHFQNPPTYDSGWVDITTKAGQYVTLRHGLNTSEVVVDITGKQSLDPNGGSLAWSKTYGGTSNDYALSVVQTSDGGYAMAGNTNSYGAGGGDFWLVKTDSAGNHQWNKTYGGTNADNALSLVRTSDEGYALVGYTDSFGAGNRDFWLVKTDSSGNMQWNRTYGGTSNDRAYSLVQTGDGGYALAGSLSGDFWLVKTDLSGNAQWNRTYGGTGGDFAQSLVQTVDGGYAIAGYTNSYGAGGYDFWLVKVNAEMNLEHQRNLGIDSYIDVWSRTYGGTASDIAYSVVQTSDGGYAIAGDGFANLVKTDSVGNVQWSRTYGGTARSVVQTIDGGYAIAGSLSGFQLAKTDSAGNMLWTKTYGSGTVYSMVQTSDGGYALAGAISPYGEYEDFWLVKTDSAGAMLSNKTYRGTDSTGGTYYSREDAYSVVQTSDGGYALAGAIGWGSRDVWLVKTDATGNHQWNKTYGGTNWDEARSLVQTGDGGYALAGYTNSYGYATPTYPNFWLVKTDSSGNALWNKTYGGQYHDYGYSVVQTSDGGYALAGYTQSYGVGTPTYPNFWLVKTDSAGTMLWSQTYGGTYEDDAYSVVQTNDGGYALAGRTISSGAGNYDFWLVKTEGKKEMGLEMTSLTNNAIVLYRGKTDLDWNYMRVRIWLIKEPSWIYGDINMDGLVDAKDLYILSRNYGKTFSLLSLSGIIAITSIHTIKTRKQRKPLNRKPSPTETLEALWQAFQKKKAKK